MIRQSRHASRVLCLDPAGRVLMLASVDPDVTRWVAPGGYINEGESSHALACRSLWQQLGLAVDDLGAAMPERDRVPSVDGLTHITWFAVRVQVFEPVPANGLMMDYCWLHPDELDSVGGTHRVEPEETSTVVREAHELLPLTAAALGVLGTWWTDRPVEPRSV